MKIKFQKTKRKRISKKFKKFLIDNKLESIYKALRTSKNTMDYFGFSSADISKIGYLKEGRFPEKTHQIWDNEYRNRMGFHAKPGKILSELVSNSDIQKISALMTNMKVKADLGTNMFLSPEICHWYLEDNYSEEFGTSGSLYCSCMKFSNCQEAIGLYEKFGKDNVELLVLIDKNDKLLGRALFWKKVHDSNGNVIQYLDRIYAVNDNIKQFFVDWAEQKNIQFYNGNRASNTLKVYVNIDGDDRIPYFDTFKGYNINSGCLTTGCSDVSLDSTDCPCFDDISNQYVECYECGSEIDEDNSYYSEYDNHTYCECCCICLEDGTYNANDCVEINGAWYFKEDDNICYSDYDNEWYIREDCVYSDYHNDYLHSDIAIYCDETEEYYNENDVDDIICLVNDEEYYLCDSEKIIKLGNKWYLKEDCSLTADGE